VITNKLESINIPPCDYCKKPQETLGAVLYGPPYKSDPKSLVAGRMIVPKFHICVDCYEKIKPEEAKRES